MQSGTQIVALAVAVNVTLLLGCTALKQLQTATNRSPSASPTATPTATAQAANASPTATPAPLIERLREMNRKAEARSQDKNDAREKAFDDITPAQERAVGQATAFNVIRGAGGLVLEEHLIRYVNDVANVVAAGGERTEDAKGKDKVARVKARRFFVGVLQNDKMDAFSLPGGYILITRGLLENLTCESDLAWVLGHEIAHIDNEDGLGAMKTTLNLQIAAGKDPNLDDPVFFGVVADKLSDVLYRVGYDRALERNADVLGVEYAVAAGYDSRGAKRVLELLATHPLSVVQRASHDTPARRIELLGAHLDRAPKGRLGVERFDAEGLQRLESAQRATAPAR